MPVHRSLRFRALSIAALVVSLLGGLLLAGSAVAARRTLSDTPDPTFQTNGRVFAILTVGDRTYIGGDFTSVRPFGAPPGTGEVPRARLAAFSNSTGALLTWNPGVNSRVNALSAAPGGHTVYVGGRFGRLGGAPRSNLGAVTAISGKVKTFRADTNGRVAAIDVAGRRVYLGGHFSSVRGKPRHAMAEVDLHGRLLHFGSCGTNGAVRSIDASPNRRHVYVGGGFTRVCGHADRNLARLTPSGQVLRLRSHPAFPVWHLVATAHLVDVAGAGPGGHIGSFTAQGKRRWVVQTDGNVQALALLGHRVYAGGNFDHICVGLTPGGNGGFDCAEDLATRHKLLALSGSTGALKAWNPSPNSPLGVSALTSSGGALSAGGSFTTVGGEPCQGYARFSSGVPSSHILP